MHDESKGDCYWTSIEDIRYELLKRLSTPVDTVYIKMERSNMLHDGKDANAEFVRKIKENVYSIELWKGQPQFEGEGYVRTAPRPPRPDFELVKIKENIRMSMYSLVQHYMLNGDLPKVLMFCNFLVEFDLSHYNHFVWLGEAKAILRDVEGSKRAYQGALDICERAKNWPKPSMDQIKSMIKGDMEKALASGPFR